VVIVEERSSFMSPVDETFFMVITTILDDRRHKRYGRGKGEGKERREKKRLENKAMYMRIEGIFPLPRSLFLTSTMELNLVTSD
jgi:hypothetical protein